MEDAYQFVLRNIRLGARIEGIYRKDIYELPPDSIRELIINAVMNCSFLQSSHVQVAIYDDRLEITSPGGLLPGVTIERMKEGYSQIRNRSLAHAFSYMNLIEGWGTGIPRLLCEMEEYGLKEPEFIDMEMALRINLYRSNKVRETNKSAQNEKECAESNVGVRKMKKSARKEKRNQQEEKMMAYVKNNGFITSDKLSDLLGIKKRRAQIILGEMVEKGALKKEGASRSTIYTGNE